MENIKVRDTVLCARMKENQSINFLPNELLIHIFKYLGHSDSKQIRLVHKRWHGVMKIRQFEKNSKLIINSRNISTIYYKIIQNNKKFCRRLPYHSVEMYDIKINDKLQKILKSMGSTVHKLLLFNSPIFAILNNCLPQLRELIVRHTNYVESIDILSIDLNKLKCFDSLDINCYTVSAELKNHMMLNLIGEVTTEIKKFCLKVKFEQEEIVLNFLQFHSKSLKHLEIDFVGQLYEVNTEGWKSTFAMLNHLEVLKINGISCTEWLNYIIDALPKEAPLQHIDLGPSSITNLITLIVKKWPDTLNNIHCGYIKSGCVKKLLDVHHTLRNFTVRNSSNLSLNSLLDGLASKKNYTLKSLSLMKIKVSRYNIFKFQEVIKNFPNLTYLSLENCKKCVSDSLLSTIFRYLLQLQHLNLSGCSGITDKGLLGYDTNSAPITNLRSLQSLSLRNCGGITNLALSKCFKFNELRKLDLSFNHGISFEGIRVMIKNCPSLEDLIFEHCISIDDHCIVYIALGLPRLRKLNVDKCLLLTNWSIDVIAAFCDSLQELRMRDIDSLNIGQAWQTLSAKTMSYSIMSKF